MPYRVEEGAIESAKYRAKLAVREVARPAEYRPRRVQVRWASAVVATIALVFSVALSVKLYHESIEPTPMERLISQMQSAPDEIVDDLAVDACYYLDDPSTF